MKEGTYGSNNEEIQGNKYLQRSFKQNQNDFGIDQNQE